MWVVGARVSSKDNSCRCGWWDGAVWSLRFFKCFRWKRLMTLKKHSSQAIKTFDLILRQPYSFYLSTDMQHKCNILAVEKYTSKLFQTSHINGPKSHLKRVRQGENVSFLASFVRANLRAVMFIFYTFPWFEHWNWKSSPSLLPLYQRGPDWLRNNLLWLWKKHKEGKRFKIKIHDEAFCLASEGKF